MDKLTPKYPQSHINLGKTSDIPSNEEIVALCMKSSRIHVGECPHVTQASPYIAIKFGRGVTRQEANNLRIASELIDIKIAKVPELYHFFEQGGQGFIVMELLRGRPLTQDEDLNILQKVVRLIRTFRSIKGQLGPLGGGISKGLLWDSDRPGFRGQRSLMQDWINSRLLDRQPPINLDCEFTLCHLDLTPRNLLLLEDGSLGIVDWDFAGFYPPSFEIGSLQMMHSDYKYTQKLLGLLDPLTENEKSQIISLQYAVFNADAYYFRPTEISNRSHINVYTRSDRKRDELTSIIGDSS